MTARVEPPLPQPTFADRYSAGRRLAAALTGLPSEHPLILALPRGGVPVAYEVANALDADLDLLIVRKLGAPGHAEYGIGAVIDGADPQLVLNEEAARAMGATPAYVQAEMRRQLAEIERRRQVYVGTRAPQSMTGRTVVVVDDGVATGGTVIAALKGVRRNAPTRLVLAVPVAPADMIATLRAQCDELVCLATPDPFYAVGLHYAEFDQTTDAQVVSLLQRHAAARRAAAAGL